MNPCELNAWIAAMATAIARNLTPEELDFYAIVLTGLGENLETIAELRHLCCGHAGHGENDKQCSEDSPLPPIRP